MDEAASGQQEAAEEEEERVRRHYPARAELVDDALHLLLALLQRDRECPHCAPPSLTHSPHPSRLSHIPLVLSPPPVRPPTGQSPPASDGDIADDATAMRSGDGPLFLLSHRSSLLPLLITTILPHTALSRQGVPPSDHHHHCWHNA